MIPYIRMPEPKDYQPSQEQEAILQRAPYLRAFIKQPPSIGEQWLDQLQPFREPLQRELVEKVGKNWWFTTLAPLTIMVKEQDVFDKLGLHDSTKRRLPDEMLPELVESLFLVGYEVGSRDAFSFIDEIFEKLSRSGLFHRIPADQYEEYGKRVFNCVYGIIRAGTFFGENTGRLNKQVQEVETPSSIPDVFKKFIDTLDIEDLEKKEG